ncbi:MAG: nickel pincer cofactor biosynthesis protein LarC [Haloferacaceae archaeon]
MDLLAFDGRTGAAGDMVVAALLDAGADRDALRPVEAALDLEYVVEERTRAGVAATGVDVVLDRDGDGDGAETGHDHPHRHEGESDDDRPHGGDAHDDGDHDHPHGGDAHDDRDHDHPHGDHSHDGVPAEGHGPGRTFAEVLDLVEGLAIPEAPRADAVATFRLLGEAEAAVHGTDLDGVAFHEVGADDAVADVVGAALLLDDLDPDRVVTTPVAAGGGEVEMAHGRYPVPVPAVVELAERADWRLRGGPAEVELLTPTGAALLAHFAEGVERLPPLTVERTGHGAGDRDLPERPNVLRVLGGESEGRLRREGVSVLETNLDDATPEALGGLQETLTEAGALDVSVLPATMKKSRPGHLVKVVVDPSDAERVARRLAAETGTLGVREHGAGHRWVADRRVEAATVAVEGEEFAVDVKVASDEGDAVYDTSAEYDDALAVARETGLPVREVMRRAEAAARERMESEAGASAGAGCRNRNGGTEGGS